MNMTFGYTTRHVLLSWSITSAIPVILNSPSRRWAGFADVFPKTPTVRRIGLVCSLPRRPHNEFLRAELEDEEERDYVIFVRRWHRSLRMLASPVRSFCN